MKISHTIKDIAKALNLSPSTVSRALRDSYEISPQTKQLVMDYATKINYQANPIARSLKEQRSYSIGIIVAEIANNFFSQVISGVESVAYDKNYQVIISQTHESAEREKLNVEYLSSRSIDGILIAMSSETDDISYLERLYENGFPMVFFDRIPDGIDTFKVASNSRQGAFDATEHLILSGKKRIAHLANSKQLSITRERLQGYREALAKHGIEYDEALVKYCRYGGLHQEEINQAVHELVQEKIDGAFLSGDKLTTGYLQAVANQSPKETLKNVALAGFTNSNVVNLFFPQLLVVRQPAFEMGKAAAELLIKMIETKYPIEEFETVTLPVEIVQKGN